MSTDFTYGGKQIVSGGPFKPNGKDMPSDARERVDCYADIANIPNPYVGLKITVKVDETNNNKMTDYIVKSLKADSIGIANMLIDEVVRYVDYLGVNTSGSSGEGLTSEQAQQLQTAYLHSQSTHVQASDIPSLEGYATETFVTNNYASKNHNHSEYASSSHRHDASEIDNLPSGGGVSQEDINTAVNDYLTKNPVQSGATAEQAAQIQANKTAIGDENSGLIKGVNDLTVSLSNVDAVSLNGKKFSEPMTKVEYDAITSKDENTIYLVTDEDSAIKGIPNYSSTEANKVLAVNGNGTALAWIDAPSGSGGGLTTEQLNKLTTAYNHSQSTHVSMSDVNSAISSAITNIEGGGEISEYTGLLMDCLGDSITARNVYQGMIKEQLGFRDVLNHGIGGSCICGDNENCFWHDNRINSLNEASDVILFTGGSNDWQTSKTMGDISSTDTNTFYGACKAMIKKLVQKYPRKLLLGATAIYGYQQSLPNQLNAHNLKLSDYMNAFKECCNLYNIPVADVFSECGINSYNKDYYFGDTDGTKSDDFLHPNKEYGHPKIANCIVKKLKQLTPVIAYVENDPNTYGNVVVSTNTLAANEGTDNTTFTVCLDGAPSTTQTVSISADNEDVTFSPSSLSFTEANYSKAQTVTVNIASDGDADNDVANINVSSKKNTQYITLNITDLTTPEAVESVSLSLSSKSLYEGDSFELTATVLPEAASNKNVTWSADNSNVTLTPNGLTCTVRANTSGSSVVTVTTVEGSKTAVCNITVASRTVEIGQNMFSSASKIVYRSGRTQSGGSYDDSSNTFRFTLESGNMCGIVAPCSPSTSYTFTGSNRTGIQAKYGLNIQYYSGEPTYVQHDEEYLIKTEAWTFPSSDSSAERTNTLTTPSNCQYIGISTYANETGEGSVVLTCVQNA